MGILVFQISLKNIFSNFQLKSLKFSEIENLSCQNNMISNEVIVSNNSCSAALK